MADISYHFLRPEWLLAWIPLVGLFIGLLRRQALPAAWQRVCDSHLLPYVLQTGSTRSYVAALIYLFISLSCLIISLSGPAWRKNPVPSWQFIQPHVIVLSMANNMLETDLSPNRLTWAKFKLHDILTGAEKGQFALLAFTEEPFLVAPLTDDAKTIDALLPSLSPNIMPVSGYQLASALQEAERLIQAAGYPEGHILVVTATPPDSASVMTAQQLSSRHIATSVVPVTAEKSTQALFAKLAEAGKGQVFSVNDDKAALLAWVNRHRAAKYQLNQLDKVPVWQDDGRWFLIPALLFLLPVFRRGWLSRVFT